MNELHVDDLTLHVRESCRRKSLEITVDRGGELVIAAPSGTDPAQMRAFVAEKRGWIYKKLAEKAERHRPLPQKEYVDGEGFLYLGRSYRLKVVSPSEQVAPIKLDAGRFRIREDVLEEARERFIQWYTERASDWLARQVNGHAKRLGLSPAGVKVQDLGFRWGSCGRGDWIYFHWKTILLPRNIAEYVAVHELIHLHESHHTPEFWRRLERAMPDYDQRKRWLALHGIEVEGL